MIKFFLVGFAILVIIAVVTAFKVNLNNQKENETSSLVLANIKTLA